MVVIKAKEFTLRPIKISDAQGYLECHQDKDARKAFTSIPENLKEAKLELKKQIAEMNTKSPKSIMFAIIADSDFAGFVNLHDLTEHPRYKHTAVIGYGIHRNYRGRGLATMAVKKVTEYGFKKLKLKRITGMCRTFNKASARVLEKSGYKLEGILRKNKFMNGKYLDDMLWAKVK
jgi:RimJ/RimL family protein N-acetyltransferase